MSLVISEYIMIAFEALIRENNKRDLGKLLAEPNEHIQRDWINKSQDKFSVLRRQDFFESTDDINGGGFDLITTDKVLTIQSKFSGSTMHMEQTRRASEKNIDAGLINGHVRYSIGEADVYIFTKPNDDYKNIDNWEFIAIPESYLEDPRHIGYLYGTIPDNIVEVFKGKTIETLLNCYEDKKIKLGLQ
jgi:hypothetical protein